MHRLLGALLLLFCLQPDWVNSQQQNGEQQQVKQNSPSLSVQEGGISILNCDYNNNLFTYFAWYKKFPAKGPAYLISINSVAVKKEDGRFTAFHNVSAKHLSLHIRHSYPGDSALYLCTASPLPIGGIRVALSDKLTFGKGTHLIVEAKSQPPTKPSVFVMRNGTNVACLVKDFYPKNVTINLQSSKKITEYDPAIVISPSGKYNAVKLGQYGDSNSVKCSVQHNNEIVYSTETEQTTNSTGDLKPMEPEIIQQTSESCHEPKVLARKVNMTSLTLLGLRLLFVKTVAVNFLLTATLFFC